MTQTSRPSLQWFPQGKETPELEQALRQTVNSVFVKRLREILTERIDQLERTRFTDYDNPNWAYKQADMNGTVRTLRNILNLISFNEGQR